MQKFISLIVGIFFLVVGYNFLSDHFSEDAKNAKVESLKDFEKLSKNPSKAIAELDSIYTETTLKVLGAPMKVYETKYFFRVDNKIYQGVYRPNEVPTTPTIEILYLAENPKINSADIKRDLDSAKSNEKSNFSLYVGLVLLAISLGSFISSYEGFKKKRVSDIES